MNADDYVGVSRSEMTEILPGIFYTKLPFVLADRGTIEVLRDAAARVPSKRARLCAHPSPDAVQHDMLIVSRSDTYVAPHRHPSKTESFLVVEGEADCLLFSDDGRLVRVIPMAPAAAGCSFFYRMPSDHFHSLRIRSPDLVFVESTLGPFNIEDTEKALWAPGPEEEAAGRAYITSLFAPGS